MALSMLRRYAAIRRAVRAVLTIAFFALLFAGVFVVALVVSALSETMFAPLLAFTEMGLLFAVLGALYGTVVALDRSAPAIVAPRHWIKPFHAPRLRAVICAALGTAAALVIWSMSSRSFGFPWVLLGGILGALFGWYGWRCAKYIDF